MDPQQGDELAGMSLGVLAPEVIEGIDRGLSGGERERERELKN